MSGLSSWTIARRSLFYYVRPNFALALGFSAATAVLVGALAVGDSVRGSLRKLVVERLANIESVLQARTFFDPTIISSLTTDSGEAQLATGIIFSSSTVEIRDDEGVNRASQVQVLALGDEFWDVIDIAGQPPQLNEDEAILNESLAVELGAEVGDEISVRVRELADVSGDNPLGDRDNTTINVPRQKVVAILPDGGIGGVSFMAGQAAARNVFLSVATLQDVLDVDNRVNAALVMRAKSAEPQVERSGQWSDELNLQLRPAIEDYGLKLERYRRIYPDSEIDEPPVAGLPPETIYDYLQLTSRELILDSVTSQAVMNEFDNPAAVQHVTYLANTIAKVEPPEPGLLRAAGVTQRRFEATDRSQGIPGGPRVTSLQTTSFRGSSIDEPRRVDQLSRQVPYSIVLGVARDCELELPNYTRVAADELYLPYCWINSWLADQIDASEGDWLQIKFFEPETVDGRPVEKAKRLMIAGVVPLTEPIRAYSRRQPAGFASAPTVFNDPGLTPDVPGVTDQASISNWDVPFELEYPISKDDDEYWINHRLTPKLFLPYHVASGADYFGSRFGDTTAIRFSSELSADEEMLRARIDDALLVTRGFKGLSFRPVRQQLLSAASGTTPFDALFLSLSFFVIVAALLLVFLLFKLAIQQRSSELGILLAQGFSPARVRQLVLTEMVLVGLIGATLGIGLGLAYAKAIIAGLESWWIGAISSSFLTFFAEPVSLIGGAVAGLLAGLLAVFLALNRASKQSALSVLRGQLDQAGGNRKNAGRFALAVAALCALAAIGLIVLALSQTGMARAGSFFGSGMLLLVASLAALGYLIHLGGSGHYSIARGNLLFLAGKSICRNPMRSSLSLGLLAVAAFLIASMGVFQMSPSEKGYGNFDLLAESAQPVYRDIGSASVRRDVLGGEASALQGSTIVPIRMRRGEDASCNNLFQVAQPTVLGVPPRLSDLHELSPDAVEFEWSQTSNEENPWRALAGRGTGEENNPIPVILDQNTADWSLKQGGSVGAITRIRFANRDVYFETVGLLANSIFQGKLLIGQRNFESLFPEVAGYQFFLIRSPDSSDPQKIAQGLEQGWSVEGMDVRSSEEVLKKFLGVQNTYISAFQSLGGLGLLLGTFGLVAVQLRSVLERRQEFALMQAVGFEPKRITRLLAMETLLLLGGGLVIGTLCASAALIPYVLEVGPELSLLNSMLMLLLVLIVGFLAGSLAVRGAMKQSVLEALRGE